jgi:hypothetical protein
VNVGTHSVEVASIHPGKFIAQKCTMVLKMPYQPNYQARMYFDLDRCGWVVQQTRELTEPPTEASWVEVGFFRPLP